MPHPSHVKQELTPARHAQLDAMLPQLRPLLDGEGVSRGWIVERTGIPGFLVKRWLVALGAKPSDKGWRLPNVKRLRDSLNAP